MFNVARNNSLKNNVFNRFLTVVKYSFEAPKGLRKTQEPRGYFFDIKFC